MKEADRLEGERKAKERADFVKAHDTVNGLTDAQAQERITQYGYNVLDEKKRCVTGGADAGAGQNAQKALLAAQNAGVGSAGADSKAAVFVSAATATFLLMVMLRRSLPAAPVPALAATSCCCS